MNHKVRALHRIKDEGSTKARSSMGLFPAIHGQNIRSSKNISKEEIEL
jgi:hypothetical protein